MGLPTARTRHWCCQVHWHFFEYGAMNSIGSDPGVLSCLMANGIRFTFHPGP